MLLKKIKTIKNHCFIRFLLTTGESNEICWKCSMGNRFCSTCYEYNILFLKNPEASKYYYYYNSEKDDSKEKKDKGKSKIY